MENYGKTAFGPTKALAVLFRQNSQLSTYRHYAWIFEIEAVSERKISRPSLEPSISSQARSGWGIMPRTLRSRLQMPAIFEREPLGLAASVSSPFSSQ